MVIISDSLDVFFITLVIFIVQSLYNSLYSYLFYKYIIGNYEFFIRKLIGGII